MHRPPPAFRHATAVVVRAVLAVLAGTAVLAGIAACSAPDRKVATDSVSTDSARAPLPLSSTDHVGLMAREPMVVEAPDGTLYLSGYGERMPVLWRSTDGGAHWVQVNVGTEADGAVGNSDVDLAVAADGTLYFIAMTYDRATFEGRGIAVGSSRDGGSTWTWTSLSRDRYDDRPWIEVAPDGTAHAIWNDGKGVSHAVSTDRGVSWTERARIAPKGSSSHLAIGPTGAIAVRVTPLSASANRFDPGVDSLAISTDGGTTWRTHGLPGAREWKPFDENAPMQRWVEPVAWDSTGALYSLWSEGTVLRVARSTDEGASWQPATVTRAADTLYFPYLVARGRGELAMTWFSGWRDRVRANVATLRFDDVAGDSSHVTRVHTFDVPAFTFTDSTTDSSAARRARDTAGEYLPVLYLRDGRLAVATTIQDRARQRYGFTFRPYRIE